MNWGSQSEIMETSTIWSLIILSIYNLANLFNEYFVCTARKWVGLVKWSTITHTGSQPCGVLNYPTAKSMVTCSHFHTRIIEAVIVLMVVGAWLLLVDTPNAEPHKQKNKPLLRWLFEAQDLLECNLNSSVTPSSILCITCTNPSSAC